MFDFSFFSHSLLFGLGLAMDAFSVSLVSGLEEPRMKRRRLLAIAGVFGAFQFAMPLAGWFFVHAAAETFTAVAPFIPYAAFVLLLFIGGKMLLEGLKKGEKKEGASMQGAGALLLQGIATSIDALSVGFTIAGAGIAEAGAEALIIGVVTFGLCCGGVAVGKRFGARFADHASVLGGVILIGIGVEILVKGLLAG